MGESNTALVVTDQIGPRLNQINNQVSQTLNQIHNQMSQIVVNVNNSYTEVSNTYQSVQAIVDESVNIGIMTEEQEKLNDAVEKGTSKAGALAEKIKGMAKGFLTIDNAKKVLDLSDTITRNSTKLDAINDGKQTTPELKGMIASSAQDSRVGYLDMTSSVTELGNTAGESFSGSEQMVSFAEQMNKLLILSGASAEETGTAVSQMAQAMGDGVISGDEFAAITGSGSEVAKTIADSMGVPLDKMQEMAESGAVTSDTIVSGLLGATDQTDAAFNELPQTWENVWTSLKNTVLITFEPILQKIGDFASCISEVIQFVQENGNTIVAVFAPVTEIFDSVLGVIQDIGNVVADNWSTIAPILAGVAFVVGLIAIAWGVYTVAQTIANAALWACPLTWIILAVIAVVAAIYFVIQAINKFAGTSFSATGAIVGFFYGLFGHIQNIFIRIWNTIADFINFFANVFNDPIASIQILFLDLASTTIGFVIQMAKAVENVINNIPGIKVDMTSNLEGFQKGIEDMATDIKNESEWKEVVKKKEYVDITEKAKAGYQAGKKFEDTLSNFGKKDNPQDKIKDLLKNSEDLKNKNKDLSGNNKAGDTGFTAADIANSSNRTANNTDSIKNSTEVSSETVSHIKDFAERDAINRFTTASIKVDMTNHNKIKSQDDIDGIVSKLTTKVKESMHATAKGVH